MDWTALFALFLASHAAGDFIFQTEWQAMQKFGGLGRDREARRALGSHVAVYTLAFVPVTVWLWSEIGAWALPILLLVAVPHLIQDDGRLLRQYVRRVKRTDPDRDAAVLLMVDQSFHVLALLGAALIALG